MSTHCTPADRYCISCQAEATRGFDPSCAWCFGEGWYDDPASQQTKECYWCQELDKSTHDFIVPTQMPAWPDNDRDGYWDDYKKTPAKFFGGALQKEKVTGIVLHCGASGSSGIARYFQSPLDRDKRTGKLRWRYVSAHAVVHDDGSVEQCVPNNRIAHHARGHSHTTVGWEHVGPPTRADWTDAMAIASADLAERFVSLYPNITTVYSHAAIDGNTGRRSDPGPHFPFYVFEEIGLKVIK